MSLKLNDLCKLVKHISGKSVTFALESTGLKQMSQDILDQTGLEVNVVHVLSKLTSLCESLEDISFNLYLKFLINILTLSSSFAFRIFDY
jgi:hypothetical protein